MRVETRIQLCRLLEQMRLNPGVFKRMGVKDVSVTKEVAGNGRKGR